MPIYLLQQRGLDLKAVGMLTPIPFVLATIATAIGDWVMTTFFAEREKYLLTGSSALTGIFLYAMYKSETITALIVTGTGSFDAAFGFLIVMTAMAVVVASTIGTTQARLVSSHA